MRSWPRPRLFGTLVVALGLLVAACTDASPTDTASSTPDAGSGDVTTTDSTRPPISVAPADDTFLELTLDKKIEFFLDDPSTTTGAIIASDMAADGDKRWAPWLIDLLRLGSTNLSDDQIAIALAEISGIERLPEKRPIDDYRIYGQWVYDEEIDPGPGYRAWKEALYGPLHNDYPRLLDTVTDDILLSRIQWGGVDRGGILELNDPERVAGTAADWMEPDEVVFGVKVEGITVAYPFRVLGHHELANDTIGTTPVSLVFCTLCRTALLFDRQVEGQVLEFETSGLLVNSNKIMIDRQTDTLWSHLEAVGLGGPLVGVELEQFAVETTTWSDWLEANPETEVLAIPDILFDENLERAGKYPYEADSAYRFYYDDPNVWFPILDTPSEEIGLKDSVIGLSNGDATLAVVVDAIVAEGPRVFDVGGQPLLVVPNSSAGARVYDATGADLKRWRQSRDSELRWRSGPSGRRCAAASGRGRPGFLVCLVR